VLRVRADTGGPFVKPDTQFLPTDLLGGKVDAPSGAAESPSPAGLRVSPARVRRRLDARGWVIPERERGNGGRS